MHKRFGGTGDRGDEARLASTSNVLVGQMKRFFIQVLRTVLTEERC